MPARIVLKSQRPPVVKPVCAVRLVQPPRSKRGDLAMLRAGVDIALQYFNTDDRMTISALTRQAKHWADRYFRGYYYAAKPSTALQTTFPNLFNLHIPGPLRLAPAAMPSPPRSPEPEGASPRDLRRAERKAMNSEAFPEFAEPTLASDEEIDQIVHLQTRQPNGATKPAMRVDAAMLRDSGLMRTLPEFLGQLARANLETEAMLAENPDAVRVELDDEEAANQPHIEMSLLAGLVETQRRRHQRRIVLPGGRPFKLPGDDDEISGSGDESSPGSAHSIHYDGNRPGDDSGDESDASTSTTASLRVNLRKRKSPVSDNNDDNEAASPPNKIRLQYQYPPPELRRFDMKRRKLIATPNPAAAPNDRFDAPAPQDEMPAMPAPASPTLSASSHGSSSSSSSGGPTRIIKIRVNSSSSSGSSSNSSAGSSSADGSRASSPDSQGSSRVIVLRDPRVPEPHPGTSSPPRAPIIKVRARSPQSRPGSSGSDGSSAGAGRCVKIRVVQRSRPGSGDEAAVAEAPRTGTKRLIEEVEE
ncbi:hypothetical protein VTK26DRAFT_5804 [Humicola hyalothermophila]